jgi:hypothetical protein
MAAERTEVYPSLVFVHRDHEFVITAFPDGADILLQIADQYGRFSLPFLMKISGANAQRDGRLNRRPIDAGMNELRTSVTELDEPDFLRFLEIPRAASDFQWTPAELDAASKIDWSKPAATLVHERHSFAIGAFATQERLVLLLRDASEPFDAPMSIPRSSIMPAVAKDTDPLEFGVKAMIGRIRTWNAAHTAAFVRSTPRLNLDRTADSWPARSKH